MARRSRNNSRKNRYGKGFKVKVPIGINQKLPKVVKARTITPAPAKKRKLDLRPVTGRTRWVTVTVIPTVQPRYKSKSVIHRGRLTTFSRKHVAKAVHNEQHRRRRYERKFRKNKRTGGQISSLTSDKKSIISRATRHGVSAQHLENIATVIRAT